MRLDHIVILVSDIQASIAFYDVFLNLLSFEKTREHVYSNEQGISIDIKQATDLSQQYQRYAPGLNHLGFTVPNVKAIIALQEAMQNNGFEVPDIQRFEEGKAIFFKDPDGMRIEVSYYQEKTPTIGA